MVLPRGPAEPGFWDSPRRVEILLTTSLASLHDQVSSVPIAVIADIVGGGKVSEKSTKAKLTYLITQGRLRPDDYFERLRAATEARTSTPPAAGEPSKGLTLKEARSEGRSRREPNKKRKRGSDRTNENEEEEVTETNSSTLSDEISATRPTKKTKSLKKSHSSEKRVAADSRKGSRSKENIAEDKVVDHGNGGDSGPSLSGDPAQLSSKLENGSKHKARSRIRKAEKMPSARHLSIGDDPAQYRKNSGPIVTGDSKKTAIELSEGGSCTGARATTPPARSNAGETAGQGLDTPPTIGRSEVAVPRDSMGPVEGDCPSLGPVISGSNGAGAKAQKGRGANAADNKHLRRHKNQVNGRRLSKDKTDCNGLKGIPDGSNLEASPRSE